MANLHLAYLYHDLGLEVAEDYVHTEDPVDVASVDHIFDVPKQVNEMLANVHWPILIFGWSAKDESAEGFEWNSMCRKRGTSRATSACP
jgi:hypothetical protein